MTAAAIGIIGFWTHAASAIGIDIYAYEDGSDVVFSYSGSIDTTGFQYDGFAIGGSFVFASGGTVSITADSGAGFRDAYTHAGGALAFGPGGVFGGDSFMGDSFYVSETQVSFDQGYAGEFIAGSMRILNRGFSDIEVDTGTYALNTGGGIVTLHVGEAPPDAAPVPAAALLMVGGGFGLLALRRRRRAG